ncbi:transmembrane protease serine 6 [Elysia marginata]|uniref:Transmembrane protease serine 6 n=1 Tax=Elysia marginata TaxID=1093978 RepID=A0AAV4F1Y3_9GAST|nr:transmembrane protease serine 6 [Elysia marginata]
MRLQVTAQPCEDKCRNTLNYYNSFIRSPVLVQYYHQSCLTRCYHAARAQASCGVQRRHQFRVIGGTDSQECEFPWVVGVLVSRFWCGGAILDRRHILTAAHCFKDSATSRVFSARDVTVTVGSSKVYLQKRLAVQAVNLHPQHTSHINDYDVAVLTLQQELIFSDCIAPLCLPPPGSSPFDADFCVAAGWGITVYSETATPPQILQKVVLPLVPQHLCLKVYAAKYINNLKLCAGNLRNGGVDTCRGDSGGPLMCRVQNRYYSYGIVSFGSICGAPNRPGIYTNVVNPEILNFVHEALRY